MSDVNPNYIINGMSLYRTCSACPEQYQVEDGQGKPVGYLRLRHGLFRVDYPDCGGTTVLTAEPKGDGMFDDEERFFYLTQAVDAIIDYEEMMEI